MRGPLVPVVLLPRYTTLLQAGDYTTTALNVEPYASGAVTFWRSRGTGTVTVYVQDSHDAVTWTDLDSAAPSADGTAVLEFDVERRWLRVKVVIAGDSEPGCACWAVGSLELRTEG